MRKILLLLFSILLFQRCGVENPIYEQPSITIESPKLGEIIGDTVVVTVNASDDGTLKRVEFYIDGILDETNIDYEAPFSYKWVVSDNSSEINKILGKNSLQIGSKHLLFAKVIDDTDLEMISNFVKVDYEYRTLISDPNEFYSIDADKIMIRSTSERLDFRITTNGIWRRIADSTGLNLGIFMDTDLNTSTGFSTDTTNLSYTRRLFNADSIYYPINDIGADFAIFSSFEGERGVYKWDGGLQKWNFIEALRGIRLESDATIAEFSINLSAIENPQSINVTVGTMYYTNRKEDYFWDLAPDEGHASYEIKNNYVGRDEFQK